MEQSRLKQITSSAEDFGAWESSDGADPGMGSPQVRKGPPPTETSRLNGLPVSWRRVTEHAWSWRIPGIAAGTVTRFGQAWTATVRELRGEPDSSGIQARGRTRESAVRAAAWPGTV